MRRFFRNAPLPPAILPTKKRTPHGRFANNFRISAGAAAGIASVRRGFQWARSCAGCFLNIPAPLTESGRLRIFRAGKSGRFGRSIGGAKKTGLSKRLVFCRACAGCRTGSGGAMPPRRNRRAPEPTSPLSDPRCLRRIRVWFCRTRRSPFSRYCLWRFSPSAFCRGTPRRPSAGRRSTTGSRRRP